MPFAGVQQQRAAWFRALRQTKTQNPLFLFVAAPQLRLERQPRSSTAALARGWSDQRPRVNVLKWQWPRPPGLPLCRTSGRRRALGGSYWGSEVAIVREAPLEGDSSHEVVHARDVQPPISITRRAEFHPGRHHFARLTSGKLRYVPIRPRYNKHIRTQKRTSPPAKSGLPVKPI